MNPESGLGLLRSVAAFLTDCQLSTNFREQSSLQSLEMSDIRLMGLLQGVGAIPLATEVLSQWNECRSMSAGLAELINQRDAKGHLKEIHGDPSLSNIFVQGERVCALDPCVARIDMYLLDGIADVAGLAADVLAAGFSEMYQAFVEMECRRLFAPRELFRYYVLRSCLIRASVSTLSQAAHRHREAVTHLDAARRV
jgi:aminoglycoside phosphotransferase family enzyme